MRANRLLSILILLQLRGRLTAEALAEEFEVSARTVYRDIDALSAAGVPVYADRGPGGGFKLIDGYQTRLTGLTEPEAQTLFLAGLPGAAAELGLAEPLKSAQRKLLVAMRTPAARAARSTGERFHLDPINWYRRAEPAPHLQAIAAALWTDRRIAVRYESWNATVECVLDPLGLVLKAGAWYLVARSGRAIRTYKVASVLDLRLLDDRFVYPAGFDLRAHWSKELNRFEASLHRAEAVIRVLPEALSTLDRLGAAIADRVLAATPDAAGRRQAAVPIESIARAAGLLLGFADTIEVMSPAELRRELKVRAERTAALYRRTVLSRPPPRQRPRQRP